jgi:chromosome segregation ATPase
MTTILMVFWSVFWWFAWTIPYFWRTYQWSKQQETIEDLQRQIDLSREALEESGRELLSNEKLRVSLTQELNTVRAALEKMTLERDEYRTQFDIEERRRAEWQGKYQRLEAAMKSALGIRS